MGVRYGFDASPETLIYARNLLPEGAIWTGFGIGRSALPMVAQSWLLGGNVRVGMEDTVYIAKGELGPFERRSSSAPRGRSCAPWAFSPRRPQRRAPTLGLA